VSVAPQVAGLRVVVGSGERVDVTWDVPPDPVDVEALLIGCHIPGHWARGMMADIRLPSTSPSP
jgi:azurin